MLVFFGTGVGIQRRVYSFPPTCNREKERSSIGSFSTMVNGSERAEGERKKIETETETDDGRRTIDREKCLLLVVGMRVSRRDDYYLLMTR